MESTRIATADKHTLADVVATGCPAATLAPVLDSETAPDTATANRLADVSTRLAAVARETANAGRVAVVEASELPTALLTALTGFVTVAESDETAVAPVTAVDGRVAVVVAIAPPVAIPTIATGLVTTAETLDPLPARTVAEAGHVLAVPHNELEPDAETPAAEYDTPATLLRGRCRRRRWIGDLNRMNVGISFFFEEERHTDAYVVGHGRLTSYDQSFTLFRFWCKRWIGPPEIEWTGPQIPRDFR